MQRNGYEYNVMRERENPQKEQKTPWRFFLCMLLFCGYMMLSQNSKDTIKSYLKADYTNELFDFMEEVSYTLNYENTSLK